MVFLRRRMDYKGYKCRRGCTDLPPRTDLPLRRGLSPRTDYTGHKSRRFEILPNVILTMALRRQSDFT
jgi:hypothetical protein